MYAFPDLSIYLRISRQRNNYENEPPRWRHSTLESAEPKRPRWETRPVRAASNAGGRRQRLPTAPIRTRTETDCDRLMPPRFNHLHPSKRKKRIKYNKSNCRQFQEARMSIIRDGDTRRRRRRKRGGGLSER